MQSCSAWSRGSLCNTKVTQACRPRQRRTLSSPAYSLSLATVQELVASNRSDLLFELMKGEISMVLLHEKEALLHEKEALLHEKEALLHEKEAKEKLHEARVHDVQARYAAELRAEQLKRELAERTVAWLKERGTLTMRGVLVELVDHAARHHNLGKKGSDLLTYKTILDHKAYQPVTECFKTNKVFFKKGAYAEELVKIKEALGQAAHDVPSAEELRVSEDAIDIFPGVVTPVQCRALECICKHIDLPYRVWDRKGTNLREVRGTGLRVLESEERSSVSDLIDRQAAVGMELDPEKFEPGAPAQPAAEELGTFGNAEADS